MAAAAVAAWLGLALVGEPAGWAAGALVWLLALAGGAVEGLAVGGLQRHVLLPFLPSLSVRRFVGATVLVAVAGWALGMAFPAFVSWQVEPASASATASGGPPWWLTLLGGAVLGALMGAVFGAAQAWALHGQVERPRRWVWANVWGWAAAMTVIMAGASAPSGPWPWPRLVALGAATGLLAGATLGAVTGLFLVSLRDTAPVGSTRVNRVVLWVLRGPAHRLLSRSLVDVRYLGPRTGRPYALPAQYATQDPDTPERPGDLVVVPGRPERKTWWRAFTTAHPCSVTLRGEVRRATAVVVRHDDRALAAYRRRWPRVRVTPDDPVVCIRLVDDGAKATGPVDS